MKHLYFIVYTLFLYGGLYAQCPTEDILFDSQEAIDSFAINYPMCTEIEGNITIASPSITDLTGLNNLTRINGDLLMYDNDSLGSLIGLENIDTISGNLTIGFTSTFDLYYLHRGNHSLTNLSGLNSLHHVGGNLTITDNDSLLNLNGLENLKSVDGNLTLGKTTSFQSYVEVFYYLGNESLVSISALSNLDHVGGNVEVSMNDALTSLEGLGSLSVINGNFTVYGNGITDFAGLNLTDINGDFILYKKFYECEWNYSASEYECSTQHYQNDALTNFGGLESLTHIDGSFTVFGSTLTDLSGLENLVSVGGSLGFNTIQLTDLSNLESLISVGESLIIQNTRLEDLSALNSLTNIPQDLHIENNYKLTEIAVLNNISSIGGDLHISENDSLLNFNGLENLSTIGGNFECYKNDVLLNFNGLDNLASIGNNLVAGRSHIYTYFAGLGTGFSYADEGNNVMTDFSGLENLTHIGGTLSIGNNDALTSLVGLDNLTMLGGLLFYENRNIADFDGLNQVDSISGDVFIGRVYDRFFVDPYWGTPVLEIFSEGNDSLVHVSGLNNLKHVGENFNIADNQSLISFMGLSSLQSIGGDFNFHNNNQAPNLAGLSGLTTIGRNFDFTYRHRYDDYYYTIYESNHALTDLTGLENLSSINGYFSIQKNTALTDLNGLANLDHNSITELMIFDNPNLSLCHIPVICDYLQAGGWGIFSNAAGCNDATEILSSCVVSTNTPDELLDFIITPNPSTGIFRVNGIPQGTYQIHDAAGRTIQSANMKNDLSIDISTEAQGVYFIVIQMENEVVTKRIIKM